MTSLLIECAVSTKTDEVAPTPQTSACQNGQGLAGACTSCNEGYTKSNGTCVLQNNLVLSVSSLTIYAQNGYSTNFTITTDQNWTITAPAWLSVSPTSGGPGSAIQVNLTTTSLNTTAGLTGILNVNATAKLDLSRTLNLTRSTYAFCGGGLGLLNTNSVAILKWVSLGANEHAPSSTANDFSNRLSNDPNGRFLIGIARGCGINGSGLNNLISYSNFPVNFYSRINFTSTKAFDDINFYSSHIVGFRTIDNLKDSTNLTFAYGNSAFTFNIYPQAVVDLGKVSECNGIKEYSRIDFPSMNLNYTCITDTQFPPELRSTMNTLLSGASKPYTIP